jgi:hypothetical protein
MEATNLSSSRGVNLTKTAGETALHNFIREGWLERSRGSFISLTERALLELKGCLLEMFSDLEEGETGTRVDRIRNCHACQEIITMVPFSNYFFNVRVNDARVCSAPFDSISIVRQTIFHLGILLVLRARRTGKIICPLGKQLVPIEAGDKWPIDVAKVVQREPSLKKMMIRVIEIDLGHLFREGVRQMVR